MKKKLTKNKKMRVKENPHLAYNLLNCEM